MISNPFQLSSYNIIALMYPLHLSHVFILISHTAFLSFFFQKYDQTHKKVERCGVKKDSPD